VGEPTKIGCCTAQRDGPHLPPCTAAASAGATTPRADSTFDYEGHLDQQAPGERVELGAPRLAVGGPGESYTLEIEGGAGGVNQTVGDLLEHCHIAEHYNSGMWRFWRVNKRAAADLSVLPDRDTDALRPPIAVSTAELIGKTIRRHAHHQGPTSTTG
jgi:hypothetical protein